MHKMQSIKEGIYTICELADEHGYQSGSMYSYEFTLSERKTFKHTICPNQHGKLKPSSTILVRSVHSRAQVNHEPT